MHDRTRRHLQGSSVIAGMLLAAAGCTHPSGVTDGSSGTAPAPAGKQSFGASTTIRTGQIVVYEDGLSIELEAVGDSRCPPKVACVWAGELAPRLRLNGGRLPSSQTLTLGTVMKKKATAVPYALTLVDATPVSATLVVTWDAAAR